jgi:hypothetical protein
MWAMRQSDRTDAQAQVPAGRPAQGRSAPSAAPAGPAAAVRSGAPSPANALALQRAVGNRAAARVLARWSRHPDEKEKGKLLSDDAAADYLRFNVPVNK